ncbi:PDDEXK nuclease domain-containing protein [Deltaproteobacteria bacterium OttesenSCG-928-M10]|nr:PDDEXK nuclease domain-containing protein [Deltaproteobacteria bacterium OttesenSCG-928-M10]
MNYAELLNDVKSRIRQAQIKASMAANTEMLGLYWDIGRMIDQRQGKEGWGKGVIPLLSRDIRNELPEVKGFSERNLDRMLSFYREYSDLLISPLPVAKLEGDAVAIVPQSVAQLSNSPENGEVISPLPVAKIIGNSRKPIGAQAVPKFDDQKIEINQLVMQLPWAQNVLLIEKVKDRAERLWYMEQTLGGGWSRDTLAMFIKNEAFSRQGHAANNFVDKLPSPQSELAASLLKDPYIFDFLTIEEPFHERELETELIRHVEKFLLELGSGFAFVGRQYHLDVGEQDFYIDLLFYHLKLRCFVVIDLKRGPFKPEYAGKLSFYCSVVDDYLRHDQDQKTIGLILCQNKNKIMAEYALSGIKTPLGISDYTLTKALPQELKSSLPSIEEIEEALGTDEE